MKSNSVNPHHVIIHNDDPSSLTFELRKESENYRTQLYKLKFLSDIIDILENIKIVDKYCTK